MMQEMKYKEASLAFTTTTTNITTTITIAPTLEC